MLFQDGKNVFNNTFVFVVLVVFLTMYGPKFSLNLPNSVKQLFENNFFKALVIFLIIYLSNKNMAVSLTMTIIFYFVLSILNRCYSENFMTRVINGAPVQNCENYKSEDIEAAKKPFYPLNDPKKAKL